MDRIHRTVVALLALLVAAWGCAESNANRKNETPPSAAALEATRGATNAGDYAAPPAWHHHGIGISAQKVEFDDDMLELRLLFENKTAKTVTVDRNLITLATPDGRVLTRDAGMFGLGNIEPTHVLPAGASHEVHLQYRVGPRPADAALKLGGVMVNGKPIELPDYIVARK